MHLRIISKGLKLLLCSYIKSGCCFSLQSTYISPYRSFYCLPIDIGIVHTYFFALCFSSYYHISSTAEIPGSCRQTILCSFIHDLNSAFLGTTITPCNIRAYEVWSASYCKGYCNMNFHHSVLCLNTMYYIWLQIKSEYETSLL